jgi:transcriptional regulator with XRE-family HTH domain
MAPLRKFPEIIERIEYVRTHLGLNKSRFSAEIGMKPQTYNNFIGAQGSKPNVELLYGIVTRFGVNPVWLFTGSGPVFMDNRGGPGPVSLRSQVGESAVSRGYEGTESPAQLVESLKNELIAIEPLLRKIENEIRKLEGTHAPLLERLIAVMKRYLELEPAKAVEDIKQMLARMEEQLSQR